MLVIMIGLSACKKDKLDGEYSILQGIWQLSYVVEKNENLSTGYITYDTTFANQLSDQYTLEFVKKGKLRQVKNNQIVREDRIVFRTFTEEHPSSEFDMRCIIQLNNKDDDLFSASFTSNKMSASRAHIDGFDSTTDNFYKISHSFIYIKQ